MTNELHDIITPHDHDVLSGRGNFVNYHAGNEHFRALVRKHKMAYVACPKPQKGKFSKIIVDEIKNRTPPGRFLKQDPNTKLWHDIGEKKALDKTRQALREGAPEIVKELGVDDIDDGVDAGTRSVGNGASSKASPYSLDPLSFGPSDLDGGYGDHSPLHTSSMQQLPKQNLRHGNDPYANNLQQIQQLAQQQQTLTRKIGTLGLGQHHLGALPGATALGSGVANPYSKYQLDMDDLEPRPIDPKIAARNKKQPSSLEVGRPDFPREQSEQSLKLDDAFGEKVEYGRLDGQPKGQPRKTLLNDGKALLNDDSTSQISVMSLTLSDINDEGNLSAMFDNSLNIGDARIRPSQTLSALSTPLSTPTSKKKSIDGSIMDMSVNTITGDEFSALGSLNTNVFDGAESQSEMSFSRVFDDFDNKGS